MEFQITLSADVCLRAARLKSRMIRGALAALVVLASVAMGSGCTGLISASSSKSSPAPQISLSTSSLNLGVATVGSTVTGALTISNMGGTNLVLSAISVTGTPFGDSGITTPATIAPNSNAILHVSFAPTAAGTDSGSVTITSNDPQSPTMSVALAGTATSTPVAPTITTAPGNQTVTVGQTATFAVVAAGTAPLGYQWQKNGAAIAGATSSTYTTPPTATTDNGSTFAVVVSNTAGSITSSAATLMVNAPAMQLSSNSIGFGNDTVGTATSQPLVVSNPGTATLSINQVNVSGSVFSVSGFSLPLNVNAGQKATINVQFLPTSASSFAGSLSIVSNASTSPTSVTLSGTGTAATLTLGISPLTLSFGNVTTGTTSAAQSVTITNTGNANVTISQLTLTGAGYSMTGGSAPVTLAPTQQLLLSLQFDPAATGTVNGSVSIVSNANGSPATVTLSGTGVAPVQHSVALSWNASTSTVAGYNVYRSTVSGSSYTKINSSLVAALNYTDTTVQSATTYYYVTTAVDSAGNESTYSNEAAAAIP